MLVVFIISIFIGLLAGRGTGYPTLENRANTNISIINVDWDNVLIKSKTTTTLQVVVNPLLLRNSSIHDNALQSLKSVAADYVRFAPWFPYPKLAVPEIKAPIINATTCKTSWNFTYMDALVEDFFKITPRVSHIIDICTTPGWMWLLPNNTTYTYPEDINAIEWKYNKGTELRDPSLKEISDYYARIASWYVKGGFADECGEYHHSGHHYNIEYWEVLNEPEAEHNISPELYNRICDAVVTAVHAVSPKTKFVGLSLSHNANLTEYGQYFKEFLDPSKHTAGIPLDLLSYH